MRTRRALRLTAVLLAVTAAAAGCDRFRSTAAKPTTGPKPWLAEKTFKKKGDAPEQEAVLRVLEADGEKFRAGFAGLEATAQPSAVAKMLTDFGDHMDKADTAGCPKEFVAARARHAKAWRKLRDAVKRLPEMYEDTDFMDLLAGLFKGETEKGKKLGGDVTDAVERIVKTYNEMHDQARAAGVEVEG